MSTVCPTASIFGASTVALGTSLVTASSGVNGSASTVVMTRSKVLQVADTQWRRMQFLYTDEEGVHVMDKETFEQFCVPNGAASRVLDWLQDDLEVSALMHGDVPVVLAMPSSQITVQVPPLAHITLWSRIDRKNSNTQDYFLGLTKFAEPHSAAVSSLLWSLRAGHTVYGVACCSVVW